MKRNSTTLYLQSPGATTPIPWIKATQSPDFSAFTEPTLSVLQKAWVDFVNSGEELEIIPDPEEPPVPQPYNPAQFLQDMFASSSFENWLGQFSNFKQSGFMNAATNAKVDNDWSVVQGLYEGMAVAIPPTPEAVVEWQELADTNGIFLTF